MCDILTWAHSPACCVPAALPRRSASLRSSLPPSRDNHGQDLMQKNRSSLPCMPVSQSCACKIKKETTILIDPVNPAISALRNHARITSRDDHLALPVKQPSSLCTPHVLTLVRSALARRPHLLATHPRRCLSHTPSRSSPSPYPRRPASSSSTPPGLTSSSPL